MLDNSVRIRCTRCKSVFRDKARRLRGGYSRQCPSCEVMIFFEENSPDKTIQIALKDAHAVRKALRVEEEEAIARRRPQGLRRGGDAPDSNPDAEPDDNSARDSRSAFGGRPP